MARSRKQAWLRDELILALDLYVRGGGKASVADRQEVSDVLRAIPVEQHLAEDPTFRSRQAVAYKLGNLAHIDLTRATAGFPHGGAADQEVWDEFADDPVRLAAAAAAIRANLSAVTPAQANEHEEEVADAPEGALLTRVHRVRERNLALVEQKKTKVKEATGALKCEACDFDFQSRYGERGADFIECHHTVPVHTLKKGSRTRLTDLALVCSNCHRMIHRRAKWLTMEQLRALVDAHSPSLAQPPLAALL